MSVLHTTLHKRRDVDISPHSRGTMSTIRDLELQFQRNVDPGIAPYYNCGSGVETTLRENADAFKVSANFFSLHVYTRFHCVCAVTHISGLVPLRIREAPCRLTSVGAATIHCVFTSSPWIKVDLCKETEEVAVSTWVLLNSRLASAVQTEAGGAAR